MTMTAQDRQAFLAERATGIGGSDIAAVFNVGYGCRLRLWREKRGETPDFPRAVTGPMELGNLLEPYFADHYARITGRRAEVREHVVHPAHPELMVHVDRMLHDDTKTDAGVLEIKSVGRGMYYTIKRTGLPEDYILQLQHAMLVCGAHWGAYAIGCRDFGVTKDDDLLRWDVERDETICNMILQEGPMFWAEVENGPAPDLLEPDDHRCQGCEYRVSCQGPALIEIAKGSEYIQDESLRPLVLEYIERRDLEKQAKEMLEDTKEELQARLGSRSLVTAAGAKIQYYTIDKKEYTVKAHQERHLRVYPAKETR